MNSDMQNNKLKIIDVIIPLFYIVNQYQIGGVSLGLILASVVIFVCAIKNGMFCAYKYLLFFFLFMLLHDLFRTFITGFNMFLWVERIVYFLFLSCTYESDEENLLKVWKIVGALAMVGILYQSFQVYALGQAVSMIKIIPFDVTSGIVEYNRPHSFFLEPAAYSAWILPLLCMCMKRKEHIWMIAISTTILLSTSSTGIIMTGVVWLYYSFVSMRNKEENSNVLLIVGILLVGIWMFTKLDIFNEALNKLSNISLEDTSNSVRLALGFQLYWAAPLTYKVFGIPYLNVVSYLLSGEVNLSNYGLNSRISYLGFVNSIGNCMLVYGIFGLFLYLKLFWELWKNSDIYSKSIVLVAFISIFSQSAFWNSLFVTQFAVMLSSENRERAYDASSIWFQIK